MKLHPLFRFMMGLLNLLFVASPAPAQIKAVDPAQDLKRTDSLPGSPSLPKAPAVLDTVDEAPAATEDAVEGEVSVTPPLREQATGSYSKDDLIGAAEGVFGKGAAGLAGMIEKVLKDQGEPNAYIAGREASGAFVVGLRYGSGTMTHAVEGQRPVYWTGPSIGFDVGGDANKVFVLVYNLYDGQDLFKRYPQVEGRAYYVGGLSGTYLRRGRIAMIPIRLGVGVRLGANVGYMRFSEKQKWLPF